MSFFYSRRWKFLSLFVLLSIFVFSTLVSLKQVGSIPLCLFKFLTQLDCPGCGLVRSFISISHGHLLQAVRYNAMGPLLYLFFLAYFFNGLLSLWERPHFFSFELPRNTLPYYLFGILFWGQWGIRLVRQIVFHS